MNTRIFVIYIFLTAALAPAAPASGPVKFDEVYQLLRTNLTGVSQMDLDRATVEGLAEELPGEVKLVTNNAANRDADALSKVTVYGGSYAYFRVAHVEGHLAEKLRAACQDLMQTNKSTLKGVVLDLRFADGTDYAAATAAADCFLDSTQPLLDWGAGPINATRKTNAIAPPLAILVNSKTSGAAEALAAALREANTGLILGSTTAGAAHVFKEFTLSNGEKLLIATSTVKLGDGTPLTNALKPDITVDETLADEKAYFGNPYKDLHPDIVNNKNGQASQPARRPTNEAELVREHREGNDSDEGDDIVDDTNVTATPTPPVIADAALARALDLLKGLAVLQQSRPG